MLFSGEIRLDLHVSLTLSSGLFFVLPLPHFSLRLASLNLFLGHWPITLAPDLTFASAHLKCMRSFKRINKLLLSDMCFTNIFASHEEVNVDPTKLICTYQVEKVLVISDALVV